MAACISTGVSRRSTLLGATSALAAAFGLAGCAGDSGPGTLYGETAHADGALRAALGQEAGVEVAGKRLNGGLLRRFYARHDYEPVWASRPDQVRSLVDAVRRARDHGLDPELFHAGLLRDEGAPPLDRELLLSGAFLSYADALARGAVPVERRRNDEVLAPEPVDVAVKLSEALGSPDAGAEIEGLAPTGSAYRALRLALQAFRSGAVPGGKGLANRVRTVEVNLERQRWLPRELPGDRVWVNVADERLVMYRGDAARFTTRVVVGEDVQKNQSPEFRATIDASFFNPPWVIPADIAAAEIMPLLDKDPEYLTKNKMVLLANGEIEQLPGPEAGLGLIMFDMPNTFDVYLHDTPDKSVFLRENRRISHGCIRVQNPRALAALLLDVAPDAVDEGIAGGSTTRNDLPKPVPVFVVYQTAFLDEDRVLQFRSDFYRRDDAIWRQMQSDAGAASDAVPEMMTPGEQGVRPVVQRVKTPSAAGPAHRSRRVR